eukprot:gene9863-20513_t
MSISIVHYYNRVSGLLCFTLLTFLHSSTAFSTVQECVLGNISYSNDGSQPLDRFLATNVVMYNGRIHVVRDEKTAEKDGFWCQYNPSYTVKAILPERRKEVVIHLSPGQGHWGAGLPSIVVVSSERFHVDDEIFYCADENTINDTVLAFGIRGYPLHGHIIYNTFTNIIGRLFELNIQPGNVLLYASKDTRPIPRSRVNLDAIKSRQKKGNSDILNLPQQYTETFGKLAKDRKVHSWNNLVLKSFEHPICFRNLSMGHSLTLDLYSHAPFSIFQKLSKTILDLFEVQSFPVNKTNSNECNVVLISRRDSRKIVNEDDLIKVAQTTFPECSFSKVIFETMTFKEQIYHMQHKTNILIGLDGTGLINALYLRQCSVVVRILPWGGEQLGLTNFREYVVKGEEFKQIALRMNVGWISVTASTETTKFINERERIGNLLKQSMPYNDAKVAKEAMQQLTQIPLNLRLNFWKTSLDTIVTEGEFFNGLRVAIQSRKTCQSKQK